MAKTKDQNDSNPEIAKLQRARARHLGLTVEGYRVLLCLRQEGRSLTYREIEEHTGYYVNLARTLRSQSNRGESHPDSLSSKGLVYEESDGHRKLCFRITPQGEAVLRSVDKWEPPPKVKKSKKGEEEEPATEI